MVGIIVDDFNGVYLPEPFLCTMFCKLVNYIAQIYFLADWHSILIEMVPERVQQVVDWSKALKFGIIHTLVVFAGGYILVIYTLTVLLSLA